MRCRSYLFYFHASAIDNNFVRVPPWRSWQRSISWFPSFYLRLKRNLL
uniref:Uncharacterized protein n=1 Tax=Manihot esculenta TaxID=3983 RepID=A0A2C9W254_MANES